MKQTNKLMKDKTVIIIIVIVFIAFGAYFIAQSKPISGQAGKQEADTNQSLQTANVGTRVGDSAPNFSYTTIDGKKVESSFFDQRVVVITSSAAWCPTCILEARQFSPVYEKYKGKQIVFITVDIDPRNTSEAIAKLKEDTSTPWDYANAQGGIDIIQKLGFDRFEITYVIDKTGVIRFKDIVITSTETLDQEIKKLLL